MNNLNTEDLAENIRSILLRDDSVKLAYLFGSLASRGQSLHDLDIAILLDIENPQERIRKLALFTVEIAKALGLSEEKVDLVDLEGASPALKYAALNGIPLVNSSQEQELKTWLLREYPDFSVETKKEAIWDVDPEPDMALVQSRIEELRRNGDFLKEDILSKPLETILESYKDILSLERAAHRIIEAMLDICRHLVSIHDLGLVESYGKYPEKLYEAKLMPQELAGKLRELAGLRNILVHRYLSVRYEALYEIAEGLVKETLPEFLNWVRQTIK